MTWVFNVIIDKCWSMWSVPYLTLNKSLTCRNNLFKDSEYIQLLPFGITSTHRYFVKHIYNIYDFILSTEKILHYLVHYFSVTTLYLWSVLSHYFWKKVVTSRLFFKMIGLVFSCHDALKINCRYNERNCIFNDRFGR